MSVPYKTARLRRTTFTRRASHALALVLPLVIGGGLAAPASAQLLYQDPDWKESEVPPPPVFDLNRVLEIDMPRMMDLKYGIDPGTITITKEGIVRYVVVARREGADGAINAFYDGIRCATGEAKTYARYGGDGWKLTDNPQWKDISILNNRYTIAIARQAVCRSAAPRGSVSDMVQQLKKPVPY